MEKALLAIYTAVELRKQDGGVREYTENTETITMESGRVWRLMKSGQH